MQKTKFLYIAFNCLFLMLLTLKISSFAYKNTATSFDDKSELNIEFDEIDFENEGEEKSVFLEFEFIEKFDFDFTIYIQKEKKKNYFFLPKTYPEKYLKFSTQPPDFI